MATKTGSKKLAKINKKASKAYKAAKAKGSKRKYPSFQKEAAKKMK